MCGCGCELGLVLAVCRAAEVRDAEVQEAPAVRVLHSRSLVERIAMIWLACMFGNAPMQRLSRGSGR
jgi:hypothetical protein